MIWKRKHLSDDEYVEQIRKRDRQFRRMRWFWPLLAIAMIYILTDIASLVSSITKDFTMDQQVVATGLIFGGMFGMLFAVVCMQTGLCIKHWLDVRTGFRTERLLLKYHDERDEQGASNQPSQPIAAKPGSG